MYLLLFVLYVCRLEVVIAPAFCRSEFVLLSHVLNVIVVARDPHRMGPENRLYIDAKATGTEIIKDV